MNGSSLKKYVIPVYLYEVVIFTKAFSSCAICPNSGGQNIKNIKHLFQLNLMPCVPNVKRDGGPGKNKRLPFKIRILEDEDSYIDVVVQFYPLFIFGLNFIFHCFKLIIIHYHTQERQEDKINNKDNLNHNMDNTTIQQTLKYLKWYKN